MQQSSIWFSFIFQKLPARILYRCFLCYKHIALTYFSIASLVSGDFLIILYALLLVVSLDMYQIQNCIRNTRASSVVHMIMSVVVFTFIVSQSINKPSFGFQISCSLRVPVVRSLSSPTELLRRVHAKHLSGSACNTYSKMRKTASFNGLR